MSEKDQKKKPNDDEWGFENSSSGFSKEAKVGLTIIVIMASVLGYMGYQKFGSGAADENETVALNEEKTGNPNETEEVHSTSLPNVNSDSSPFVGSDEVSQQEPPANSFGDETNNSGSVNLSQNNNSSGSNPFGGNETNEGQNNVTAEENANSGNPFGTHEASNPQKNANNPPTEQPDYLQKQDAGQKLPLQANREMFQNNQNKMESDKNDEWGDFSKPVAEKDAKSSGSTDAKTAGFEAESNYDQFQQNNKPSSSHRNSQGFETRSNQTSTQTYDNRFGGYRPAESTQNSGSGQFQSTNRYNTYDTNSSTQNSFQQTQSLAPRPLSTDQPQYQKITSGDNYWNLSKKHYGAGRYFRALEEYNKHRIPDSKKMREGMIVLIPTKEILEQRFSQYVSGGTKTTNKSTTGKSGYFRGVNGQPMYRTGKNDVLTNIAQKHLGRSSRWIQIYEMNRHILKNPNNLKIGIELRLPTDASNVRIVQDFREIR